MSDSIDYSIIIPVYNRAEEVNELLGSLAKMHLPKNKSIECIIVDDGSTDNTGAVVEEYTNKISFPIRFIQQENQGPGAARNNGMEHAKGTFFIFLDSDTLVHPRWLQAIEDAVRDGADAFGGPDRASEDFTALQKAINYSMTSFITTGGIRGKKKRVGRYYPRSFNMGLRREVYEKIGGFGGLRHGQDIEFSQRIIDSGATTRFVEDAVVYHKRRTSLRKFFKQVFNWGVARINLYKVNPDMLEVVHIMPAIATIAAAVTMVLAILGITWSYYLIAFGLVGSFFAGIHGGLQTRSVTVGCLIILVIPIQIIGYGVGFISAWISRVFLGKSEFTGFVKKYYR